MSLITRQAVRVLLLNDNNELLLMQLENFDISSLEGTKNQRFWCTIGGALEAAESLEQAALREIYEETGIEEHTIKLGPVVWHGTVDLILKGKPVRLEEWYIVAKTKQHAASLHKPTEDEQQSVTKLQWVSLEDIKNSTDVIFPISLSEHLPAILDGIYPEQPIEINLKKG